MRSGIPKKISFGNNYLNYMEYEPYDFDPQDRPLVLPFPTFKHMTYPTWYYSSATEILPTKHVFTLYNNKAKQPIYVVKWSGDGKWIFTGGTNGEISRWNNESMAFEGGLSDVHKDSAIRAIEWAKNEEYMLSGDNNGRIVLWDHSLTNKTILSGHTQSIRQITIGPTDEKFVSCSDDQLCIVWDIESGQGEREYRGHGGNVKCCDYHPFYSLIVSGGKDKQLQFWDPRSKQVAHTKGVLESALMEIPIGMMMPHGQTINRVKWNKNGNWLLTASADRCIKAIDIRVMKEFCWFRSHEKEVGALAWHPICETLFASAGGEGSLCFWNIGDEYQMMETHNNEGDLLESLPEVHDAPIGDIQWHPLGHLFGSASDDASVKFWCRPKPGDFKSDIVDTTPHVAKKIY